VSIFFRSPHPGPMGKGRDKRKEKRQERKGITQSKKESKEERKQRKWERREHKALEEAAEHDDVEALLAAYRHQKKVDATCVVEDASIPSARVNASLTVHPTGKHELVFFGGELWTGKHLKVFNDLLIYRADKDQWRSITGEYFPAPRSSHQAVNLKGHMYIFGGEFSSPSQASTFHFHDLWSFDFKKLEWTEHTVRHGPSARSGHRMVAWKKNFILFGGFYAAKAQADITYYNDLWMLQDVDGAPEWQAAEYGPYDDVPKPRSGCCLGCHENTLFMFGGYGSERGDEGRGARGVSFMDLWQATLPTLKWQRIRTAGIAPSVRSGMSVCLDRKRGLFFGGVWDYDDGERDLQSEFFNDIYALNLESFRWFPVKLKAQAAPKGPAAEAVDSSPGGDGPTAAPSGRINALLVVLDNKLYLYGGMREEAKREVTHNDLWALNLTKLDGWKLIFDDTKGDWEGDEEDDKDSDKSSSDGDTRDEAPSKAPRPREVADKAVRVDPEDTPTEPKRHKGDKEEEKKDGRRYELAMTAASVDRLLQDLAELSASGIPTPNPGETFPDFYHRSSGFWQQEARAAMVEDGLAPEDVDDDLVEADGRVLAKGRFNEVRPILGRLEATQTKMQRLEALLSGSAEAAASSSSSSNHGAAPSPAGCHCPVLSSSSSSSDDDSDGSG